MGEFTEQRLNITESLALPGSGESLGHKLLLGRRDVLVGVGAALGGRRRGRRQVVLEGARYTGIGCVAPAILACKERHYLDGYTWHGSLWT